MSTTVFTTVLLKPLSHLQLCGRELRFLSFKMFISDNPYMASYSLNAQVRETTIENNDIFP